MCEAGGIWIISVFLFSFAVYLNLRLKTTDSKWESSIKADMNWKKKFRKFLVLIGILYNLLEF